jgi:hypothetical protein
MTAHSTIAIETALAFRLLDEVSRARALAEDESLLLEQLVCRGHRSQGTRIAWTPKLERALLRASYRNSTIRQFAADNGMSEMCAYKRLEKLRKKQADKEARLCGKAK